MATERLYKRVADDLFRVIESGQYDVGDRLPAERDLALHYNVSRPTIREAVIALEIAGRVEVRKGSGVYVRAAADAKTMGSLDLNVGPFELTEARLLIEGEIAALAATQITTDELDELAGVIGLMVRENETPTPGVEHADKDFHMIIARASRNSALIAICDDLWNLRERSRLTQTIYETVRRTGVRPSIDEHWAIHAALAAKNPTAARAAMRTHLSRVIDTMLHATEVEAVEEAKRRVSIDRKRYTHFTSSS